MRARRLLLAVAVTAAACAGSRAVQQEARGPSEAGRGHRQVDVGLETCSACHARVTPAVTAQWRDGRHGMSLVECVVCHGSTGADFKARPGTTTCSGCHAEQVASITAAAGSQDCFACHPAHGLRAAGKSMSHPAKPKEATR